MLNNQRKRSVFHDFSSTRLSETVHVRHGTECTVAIQAVKHTGLTHSGRNREQIPLRPTKDKAKWKLSTRNVGYMWVCLKIEYTQFQWIDYCHCQY